MCSILFVADAFEASVGGQGSLQLQGVSIYVPEALPNDINSKAMYGRDLTSKENISVPSCCNST